MYLEFIKKQDGPPKDKDIEIIVVNNDVKNLIYDTSKIVEFLKKSSWVKNLDSNLNVPGVEWELKIDRVKADQHGVEIELIGNSIQMLTHGLKVTDFMPEDSDEEVDIIVKYEKKFRTLDELDNIIIDGNNGPVSLSLFVERKPINFAVDK